MSLVLDMENQIIQKELISDDHNLPGILLWSIHFWILVPIPAYTRHILHDAYYIWKQSICKVRLIYFFDTCTMKVKLTNCPLHKNI